MCIILHFFFFEPNSLGEKSEIKYFLAASAATGQDSPAPPQEQGRRPHQERPDAPSRLPGKGWQRKRAKGRQSD